jgi:hypothetical protein
MATPKLSDFLRQQQEEGSEGSTHARLLKQEWLSALSDLFKDISSWLEPQIKEKLLTISRGEITVREDPLGTYKAPTMEIHANIQGRSRVVPVQPIARMIFGGAGRVDLGQGPKSRVLVRTAGNHSPKMVENVADRPVGRKPMSGGPRRVGIPSKDLKWMISTPDPKDEGVLLTEDTLSDALQFLFS